MKELTRVADKVYLDLAAVEAIVYYEDSDDGPSVDIFLASGFITIFGDDGIHFFTAFEEFGLSRVKDHLVFAI